MRVLTLATLSSLPRVRALARSLRRHQPDWAFEAVLVARDDVVLAAAENDKSLRLRSVSQELDLDLEALLALHDEQDLSTLLLPSLLARYAERAAEPVLHLPSTVWVLGDLQPIESALSARSVLLVPRTIADVPAATTAWNPHAPSWIEPGVSRRPSWGSTAPPAPSHSLRGGVRMSSRHLDRWMPATVVSARRIAPGWPVSSSSRPHASPRPCSTIRAATSTSGTCIAERFRRARTGRW